MNKTAPILFGIAGSFFFGLFLYYNGYSYDVVVTATIAFLCAAWWMTEAIPVPVTGLIPLALFPLSGVLTANQVALAYGSNLILLYMGGFILSTAMERSGAHRRIALNMVNTFRGGERSVVFGFMLAAASLSMWISNTATGLMLLPIAMAVLESTQSKKTKVALLLGVAYACNIGGMGTPIGTPSNLIFMKVYTDTTGETITFIDWMAWGMPALVIFLPLMFLWLTRGLDNRNKLEVPSPGEWRPEEKRTLTVFGLTALAWVTRQEPFGGWSQLINVPQANDASVAMVAVILLFLIPNGKGEKLLDWETAVKIPWGILILFAGGICIATGFVESGISTMIGDMLASLTGMNLYLLMLMICLIVTFLTEMTSNTATSALLMPILAAAAIGAAIDPKLLMVPAVLTASCAFMLPVATGPNAVVYATGQVSIKQMIHEGLGLNLLGTILIASICYFIIS
jgi:solute carrier family 13 (sodium-dependent dicarboxylate transporter), member 2/3/5